VNSESGHLDEVETASESKEERISSSSAPDPATVSFHPAPYFIPYSSRTSNGPLWKQKKGIGLIIVVGVLIVGVVVSVSLGVRSSIQQSRRGSHPEGERVDHYATATTAVPPVSTTTAGGDEWQGQGSITVGSNSGILTRTRTVTPSYIMIDPGSDTTTSCEPGGSITLGHMPVIPSDNVIVGEPSF